MPIKYSYELLQSFCDERNVVLTNDYSSDKLFGSTKIIFECTSCKKENTKCFTYLITRNTLCKRCVTIQSLPKQKKTMMEKYGVEHASQNSEIRDKIKKNFIEKYGVDNPSKTDAVKNKQKETCLKKYGAITPLLNDEIKEKIKETCLERYGVENPLLNINIKDKIKQTCLVKYGVENPLSNEEVKQKVTNTNLERYGVERPIQNDDVKTKMVETFQKNYGTNNPLANEKVKQKVMNTNLERYGVKYPSQNKKIREKTVKTYYEKFGVENPMQNIDVAEKSSKNAYNVKKYTFPSKKIINCQGYEPFAFDELIEKNFSEDDIVTDRRLVPTIWYNDKNGKKRRHFVDIFIPSKNLCIEVKSVWTIKKESSNIFDKQTAAKELGHNYEIWVYDSKGNKIETHN